MESIKIKTNKDHAAGLLDWLREVSLHYSSQQVKSRLTYFTLAALSRLYEKVEKKVYATSSKKFTLTVESDEILSLQMVENVVPPQNNSIILVYSLIQKLPVQIIEILNREKNDTNNSTALPQANASSVKNV